jgi:hypothetical protein
MDLDPKYDDYDFPTTAPETQSGHPGHTTREQDAQVHQLRAMLEQEGYTDHLDTLTLLRFLRARKFNVELSKQMYEFFPLTALNRDNTVRLGTPLWWMLIADNHCAIGSSPMKRGGRNSEAESTISSALSSTLKSHKSLSIIHNTTTKQTRFAVAFFVLALPRYLPLSYYTFFAHTNTLSRTAVQSTSKSSAKSTSTLCTRSPPEIACFRILSSSMRK